MQKLIGMSCPKGRMKPLAQPGSRRRSYKEEGDLIYARGLNLQIGGGEKSHTNHWNPVNRIRVEESGCWKSVER